MRVRVAAIILLTGASARLSAQSRIGEVRIEAIAGQALRAGDVDLQGAAVPPPEARGLVGVTAGLAFVTGRFSAGPEGSMLFGSDRRLWTLGAVGRLALGWGPFRPYILIGGGYYMWRRKVAFPGASVPTWTDDTNYLSGSLGAGIAWGIRRVTAVVEVRGHKSLEYVDSYGTRDLLSLSAGAKFAW